MGYKFSNNNYFINPYTFVEGEETKNMKVWPKWELIPEYSLVAYIPKLQY